MTSADLASKPDKGPLLENALVMQFIKQAIDFRYKALIKKKE